MPAGRFIAVCSASRGGIVIQRCAEKTPAGIVTDESRNIDRLKRLSDLALAALVE